MIKAILEIFKNINKGQTNFAQWKHLEFQGPIEILAPAKGLLASFPIFFPSRMHTHTDMLGFNICVILC